MTFFTQEKGTLLPEKGHLAKLVGGAGPPCPPRFLRRCIRCMFVSRILFVFVNFQPASDPKMRLNSKL
jgi:hypothetical protein